MTKIGFTGSRKGMTLRQKAWFTEFVSDFDEIEFHHGDCVGADEDGHNIVDSKSTVKATTIVIHPPSDEKLRAYCIGDIYCPSKPYLDRNRDIVDETDFLVAFPNGYDGASKNGPGGTWYTIRYADSLDKRVIIVYGNAKVDVLNG